MDRVTGAAASWSRVRSGGSRLALSGTSSAWGAESLIALVYVGRLVAVVAPGGRQLEDRRRLRQLDSVRGQGLRGHW